MHASRVNSPMKSSVGGDAPLVSRADKELIVAHIRRLMADAEDFFVKQQQLLRATYVELTEHVDHLKYRSQFFVSSPDAVRSNVSSGNRHQLSVPMPLNTLTCGAAGVTVSGSPFAFGTRATTGAMAGGAAAVSATPMRHADPAAGSPYTASPLAGGLTAALGGLGLQPHTSPSFSTNSYQVSAGLVGSAPAARVSAASTPPNKQLQLATESRSPSMCALLEEGAAAVAAAHSGDWGSLSLATNGASHSLDHTLNAMASPFFTNTLSLDDLLARFAGSPVESGAGARPSTGTEPEPASAAAAPFTFDMLYEELVGGGGGQSRTVEAPARPGGSLFDRNTAGPDGGSGGGGGHTPRPTRIAPAGAMDGDRGMFGSAVQLFGSHSSCTTPKQAGGELLCGRGDGGAAVTAATPSPYALLNAASERGVIPIDSIRSLCDHHLTKRVRAVYENGRPTVVPSTEEVNGFDESAAALGIDPESSCQVLVEFKRKRVLQYDSTSYVAPGQYVIVGGDRGEDLGLVIYAWCETTKKQARWLVGDSSAGNGSLSTKSSPEAAAEGGDASNGRTEVRGSGDDSGSGGGGSGGSAGSGVVGIGLTGSTLTRSIGVGSGTVLRLATDSEVEKLLTVQPELERRAVDVCSQRVIEHALPMVIVDAEYQFNKKKLTFYYEARQRMDFRDLVRDLYKTFRARIWMELVDS